MPFILTGFRQIAGSRVFAFENIEKDKPRTIVTVRADVNVGRKHGIQLQDWPLLCVEMLERDNIPQATGEVIFDEARMLEYADARAATRLAALLKRKRPFKPGEKALSALAAAAV